MLPAHHQPKENHSGSGNPAEILPKPNLGSLWQLPSDHIAVAAEFLGCRLATWNVLNSSYMHHIERGDQGLNNSAIITEGKQIRDEGSHWTVREQHVVELIKKIMEDCSILALQECSRELLDRLSRELPTDCELRVSSDAAPNQIATVFNRTLVEVSTEEISQQGFSCQKDRQTVDMRIRALPDGEPFHLLHCHVPGDPNGPGLELLAEKIKQRCNPESSLVVMGDLNFPASKVFAALERAGIASPLTSDSRPTTLATDGSPVKLDHILAFTGNQREELIAIDSGLLSPEFSAAQKLLI